MSVRRHLLVAGGFAAFGIGTVGIVVPILPTVPFYLLAAFCFAGSHPAWERRLLDHPRYGPSLRAWRERRTIARRGKISATAAMVLSGVLTLIWLGWPWGAVPWPALVVAAAWIWTRAD